MGMIRLSDFVCATCAKPYRAWFANAPVVKNECAACYSRRTETQQQRRERRKRERAQTKE